MTGTRPWAGKSPPGGARTGGNHFGRFNCAGGRGRAGLQGAVPCLSLTVLGCPAISLMPECRTMYRCTRTWRGDRCGNWVDDPPGRWGWHESCTTYRCTRGEKGVSAEDGTCDLCGAGGRVLYHVPPYQRGEGGMGWRLWRWLDGVRGDARPPLYLLLPWYIGTEE